MIISYTSGEYIPDSTIAHLPKYLNNTTHVFVSAHSDYYEPVLITLLQQQQYILRVYVTRAMLSYKTSTLDLLFTSTTYVELVFIDTEGFLKETFLNRYITEYPELLL